MPAITGSTLGRMLLFAEFSAHPWTLSPRVTLQEMRSYAKSPSFDELLLDLAYGEEQKGTQPGRIKEPLVIGWGDCDRVCFPQQASRAEKLFPDAQLHWFRNCGHFPQWDSPKETTQMILDGTLGKIVSPAAYGSADKKMVIPSSGFALRVAGGLIAGVALAFIVKTAWRKK